MKFLKKYGLWIAIAVAAFLLLRRKVSGFPTGATIGNPNNMFDPFGTSTGPDQAKVADLNQKVQGFRDQIANATAGYAKDHFGGQTPQQFQAYIDGLTAQLAATQAQEQDLLNGVTQ